MALTAIQAMHLDDVEHAVLVAVRGRIGHGGVNHDSLPTELSTEVTINAIASVAAAAARAEMLRRIKEIG